MIVGVVGGGVVGQAIAKSYFEFCETRVYDVQPERRTHTFDEVLAADFVFVCLPTPQKQNDIGLNTDVLVKFFESLEGEQRNRNFVIRSTVPVGFTRATFDMQVPNVLHSPEFLTARCSFQDAMMPMVNMIGSPAFGRQSEVVNALMNLYSVRFPEARTIALTSDETELVKILRNTFFSAKIAMLNEFRTLCDKLGVSWDDVRNAFLQDNRINSSHTQVPGPDGKRGFGGTCLPKDLSEFRAQCRASGVPAPVATAAFVRNAMDRQAKPTSGKDPGQVS